MISEASTTCTRIVVSTGSHGLSTSQVLLAGACSLWIAARLGFWNRSRRIRATARAEAEATHARLLARHYARLRTTQIIEAEAHECPAPLRSQPSLGIDP